MNNKAAERIDQLRRIRGIPVTEFVAALGISRATYYDRMNGNAWPDAQLLKAAALLETSAKALRYGPEGVFAPEDQDALESILKLLLDSINERGSPVDVDTIARMATHLYGVHTRGGNVDRSTVDTLIRLAIK